jgi:hypothetical protein
MDPGAWCSDRTANLYVGANYPSAVKRYNGTTGAFIDTFGDASNAGGGLDGPFHLTFTPVPEPSSFILVGLGLAMGGIAWKRKRQS